MCFYQTLQKSSLSDGFGLLHKLVTGAKNELYNEDIKNILLNNYNSQSLNYNDNII